jgi:LPXTG-site transpeptidase (sortase) family protein
MAAAKSLLNTIWENKIKFLFVYFVVFLVTYLVLVAIDFLPEPKTEEAEEATTSEEVEIIPDAEEQELPTAEVVAETVAPALPTEIYIERLNKTIAVLNPTSRAIADLDEALLSGVVRHPDSAHLAQTGNVFILGHSSYLPNVFNENFQAFNGIQELKWGDTIEVSAAGQVFVYRVENVFEARAQEVTVPIAVDDKLLTLATCNSFGTVDDRYIVEARQVAVREA